MDDVAEELALEKATLRLVNAVAFLSGTRAHSRGLQAVTGVELGPSDLRLIELLGGRGAIATSVVARELGIDLGQASRQAAQLQAAGHLVRRTDPADRRRTLLELSESASTMLDEWLLAWSRDYQVSPAQWSTDEIEALGEWFALVHDRLVEALPDRPQPMAADRWAELAGAEYDTVTRSLLHPVIGIVTWVGQSGGFNDLLELIDVPLRETGLCTLQVIEHSGPLSVAEVAARLVIDPSQASKRLRNLTTLRLVDRAVDGFDRRSNLVRISRKGAALLERVFEVQLTTFEKLIDDLNPQDRLRWTPLVESYVEELLGRRSGSGRIGPSTQQPLSPR
ncbi:MarR family winged helix-turn-helix transcriptional regulator [Streptomyces mirabilis]|uniref:MarR family winged helix-turn-helix transcriptional regulator n=1 Tax=Streptomyces mirabilis TaxID=68239 RepID=UPI0033A7571A